MPLTEPSLSEAECNAFRQSVENVRAAVSRQLAADPRPAAVIGFVQTVQQGVDAVVQARFSRGAQPDCKAGCSHCCHTRVEALPAEVFRIARHLAARATEDVKNIQARLAQQIAADNGALSWKDRPACAFLQSNRCGIYEIRPGVCRKTHSLDVTQCASSASEIPEDLGVLLDAEALIKGAADAYEDAGYESAGTELARSVLRALAEPSLEAQWHQGEHAFDGVGVITKGKWGHTFNRERPCFSAA